MPRYLSQLIGREMVAEGTSAFKLQRPAGFQFRASQHLTLTLRNPRYNDARGNTRTFSIASPPQEAGHLLVATRLTGSALKRSLMEMDLGTPVSIFGPAGSFTLPPSPAEPMVFIAGGIGITPFRCMLLDAAGRGRLQGITLIYTNRNPEGSAFHEELAALAAAQPGLRYLPTMTDAESSGPPWTGERRRVDAAFLQDYLGDQLGSLFYVAGPPGLVAGVTSALAAGGVAANRVVTEEFAGYGAQPAAAAPADLPAGYSGFARVAKVADLTPGIGVSVLVGGRKIALFNVNGAFYAVNDSCPHEGATLSDGDLVGTELTCPLHGSIFDITTGAVLEEPAETGLTCYRTRVSGSNLEVEL